MYRTDPTAMRAVRDELDKAFTENFANAVVDAESPQMKMLDAMCRANLESNVTDPELSFYEKRSIGASSAAPRAV